MMKIGIFTFYRLNYGATLQALAFEKYLEALGHTVEFIACKYTFERQTPLLRCLVSRHLKGVQTKLKKYVSYPVAKFAVKYPQTKFCRSLDEVRDVTEDCDAFIVGSDQMWNPFWCSSALPLVMLDFVPAGKPRISYAASFGTTVWTKEQHAQEAGELLRKFTKISVREESGVELVRQLSGRTDAVCLLDPTLLQNAQFYRGLFQESEVRANNKSYIFRYVLDEWDDDAATTQKAFELVQQKLQIQQVETDCVRVKGLLAPLCRMLKVTSKVPVPEWLKKIAHSDFVFTNSFHGTVFAILFQKPFVSILLRGSMRGMNERILSLLKILGLEDRAVYADEVTTDSHFKEIDWAVVYQRLDARREKTKQFLQEALHG